MEVEHSRASRRLLDAAARLFYERGIQAVGVDEVVAEAGVAKMTLYRNFGSKDDLVAAYLERRDAWWETWFTEKVISSDVPPRERVLVVFDVLEEWFETDDFHGCAFINADVEHAGSASRPVIYAHKRKMREFFTNLARDAGLDGEVGGHLFLLMEGAMVTARIEGGSRAAQEARRAAELLIAA